MAEVHFLPWYAEVLDGVVAAARRDGAVDVECRSDLDPAVVAGQVRRFAAAAGLRVRCAARAGRVEVRVVGRRPAGLERAG